jgi:hypothetical protein
MVKQMKRAPHTSSHTYPDCVQVVIGLIVTPEGFPLGYEVLPGNTADCTTLRDMPAAARRAGSPLLNEFVGCANQAS